MKTTLFKLLNRPDIHITMYRRECIDEEDDSGMGDEGTMSLCTLGRMGPEFTFFLDQEIDIVDGKCTAIEIDNGEEGDGVELEIFIKRPITDADLI